MSRKVSVILFGLLLFACSLARGQSASDIALANSPGGYARVVPNAKVILCQPTDTAVPCTQRVQTYVDLTLSTTCTLIAGGNGGPMSGANCNNPGVADVNGNYSLFVPSGSYQLCVFSGNNWICVPKTVGGGGATGPGTTTPGNFALWNSALGQALSDAGFGVPIPNAALNSATITILGTNCTLGSTCSPSVSPGGSASGDLGGTYPGPSVSGFNGIPKCNSFSASNGQALAVTTASSPNPCLTGANITGFANPMTTLGDIFYGGAAGAATRLAGPTTPNGVPQIPVEIPLAGAATAIQYALPGILGRSVTGTSDTILSTDCNPQRVAYTGSSAVAVTLPTPSTLGVANCTLSLANNTTNTVTITPTTWTISRGSGGSTGASLVLAAGQEALFFVDPKTASNWAAAVREQAISGGSGVTLTRTATGVSVSVAGTPLINTCMGTVGPANGTAYVFYPAQGSVTTCTANAIPNASNNEIRVGVASTAAHLSVVTGTACTSASTAVTLYKNGAASALTVTLGTTAANTYVSDDADTVSFNAGDTYSIRIVTGQATETCANLRAIFYLQ